jgi:hypothetical protein
VIAHFRDEVAGKDLGTVELREGRAEPSSDGIRRMLLVLAVLDPVTHQPLTLDDGARFIEALPFSFRGMLSVKTEC